MLNIEWRSGFGYGDFVTGLGYAHNASIKYDTAVNINFHWPHDLDYKESNDDPETIIERMWYVYGTMKQLDNVTVSVTTNSNPAFRFINQFDEFNPLHGLWYHNLDFTDTNIVVLWRSKYNTFFPGQLKDPFYNHWDIVIEWLTNQGYNVKEVTYRTPISQVIKYISKCKFGIGYDGMVHQLFKYMWKPLIVCCERHKLNNLLIPQAALEKNVDVLMERGVDYYVTQSLLNIHRLQKDHKSYINDKKDFSKHPQYICNE